MIEIKGVKKKFGYGKEEFFALNGVNLDIENGEFVAICGKSGSGKSTLLNMIGTLDRVSEGSIIVDGQNISQMGRRQLAAFRNEKIGFVFQSFYLEPWYSVYENVELPLVLAGRTGRKNRSRVEEAINSVGLINKIKSKAANLSGGEQQRVAIARAMINDPDYILADEPCGNLDTANSDNIMRILKALHSSGKTVIMVTHDACDAAKAERVVTMSDGRVIYDTAEALAV